jgi:hypothetical protein
LTAIAIVIGNPAGNSELTPRRLTGRLILVKQIMFLNVQFARKIAGLWRRQRRPPCAGANGKRAMPTLDWIGRKAVLNHHREVPYHLVLNVGRAACRLLDAHAAG